MKAVILASGLGTRFGNVTKKLPKCLIKVNGKTILERILLSLIKNNIKEIIITTGHLDQMIKDYIRRNDTFKQLSVAYIHNSKFLETDYIYSLWMTKNSIANDDILLLHGDLVYDESLLSRLVTQKHSAIAVNKNAKVPQKDFKARVKSGKVIEIGVNVFGKNVFLCMPMYKFLKRDLNIWMKQIDKYVEENNIKCYAEDALNDISNQINLCPLYFDKELCMEIDNEEDLSLARTLVNRNK